MKGDVIYLIEKDQHVEACIALKALVIYNQEKKEKI